MTPFVLANMLSAFMHGMHHIYGLYKNILIESLDDILFVSHGFAKPKIHVNTIPPVIGTGDPRFDEQKFECRR